MAIIHHQHPSSVHLKLTYSKFTDIYHFGARLQLSTNYNHQTGGENNTHAHTHTGEKEQHIQLGMCLMSTDIYSGSKKHTHSRSTEPLNIEFFMIDWWITVN